MRYAGPIVLAAVLLSLPLSAAEPTAEAFLPLDVVKEQFNLGKKYLAEGKSDLAWLFFRNAVALEKLSEPDDKGARAKAMQAFVDRSLTLDRKTQHPCPVCVDREQLAREVGNIRGLRAYFKKCPRCGTSKTLSKPGTVAQWKARVESAKKGYARLQKERGMIEVGEAWVPKDHVNKLTETQRAVLAKALPTPCADCGGCGMVDCKICNGIGEVKCRRCMMGIVMNRERKLIKTTVTHYSKCPVCKGIGGGFCPLCKGKGRMACKSCAAHK